MPVDPSLTAAAGAVRSRHVVTYARARGWVATETASAELLVLSRPDHDLAQLLVPKFRDRSDYARRILDVAERLAQVEARHVVSVLNDLQAPLADTLRIQVDAATTAGGTILLEHGLEVLRGARDSILSAASSVLRPAKHHRRMSFAEAEALAASASLGQTEAGSFTVRVLCPIEEPYGDPAELLLPEAALPFVRRVTRQLMQSVERLRATIAGGNTEQLYAAVTPAGEPVVSANLCEALARFRRDPEDVRVRLRMDWAPAFPEAPGAAPVCVTLENDILEPLTAIAQHLRGEDQGARRTFVGSVETLNGDLDQDGHRFGQVEVLIFLDGEVVRAKLELSADNYAIADQAHMRGEYVTFTGVLRRGARKGTVAEIGDFHSQLA
jgi:hypothetical protein